MELIHLSGWVGGERLFESDWEEEGWALIRGWALTRGWAFIRINTVYQTLAVVHTIPDSFCAGAKIILHRASVHT